MRRRLLIAIAVLVVLVAGGVAAYLVHRGHEGGNIRGSSTEEFVTTASPTVTKEPLTIPWPMFGLVGTRTRVGRARAAAAVPAHVDVPRREPRRVSAVDRLRAPLRLDELREVRGGQSQDRAARRGSTSHTLRRRVARDRSAATRLGLRRVPQQAAVQRAVRRPRHRRRGDRLRRRASGRSAGERRSARRRRRRSSSAGISTSATGTATCGTLDARTGKTIWRFHTGGAVKGGVAIAGGRLYVGSYDGHVYCLSLARQEDLEVAGRVAALRKLAVLLDAGGRVRARLHRLDRRQGLLVRRDEREAALVARHRRLRLRVAGRLRAGSSTRAPTAAASSRSTRRRET